ncbi:MAG: acetyltransferase [Candidatus Thiodiazotropha sp. (ex Epidulcina cf. delphinae)]|nr:acetyltransferase [Candidatus Thiodiazotropha sp. (ex Epidulcina cf. delphinae)]
MFLMQKNTEELVEILGLGDLINPNHAEIVGRYHAGEELQDAETFSKGEMKFPSGEPLPQCWLDAEYRQH